jgi:hypothetical protein
MDVSVAITDLLLSRIELRVLGFMLPGDSILRLKTWNSKSEISYGGCITTNHHGSCGRTAERFAEAPHRFLIQPRLTEGFVAGFSQPVQAPKLIQ